MSGRLIITTKKTYCPWSQQNVERVLRDERIERERLEREARAEKDAAAAKRRGLNQQQHGGNEEKVERHINLFPEAEEAELRLARGINSTTSKNEKVEGILPVPLGGEEASNRKTGRVPFYLQSRPDDEADLTRVLGRKVEADAITGRIMRDQAVGREVTRKQRMDPMARFYKSGECRDAPVGVADGSHVSLKSKREDCCIDEQKDDSDLTRDNEPDKQSSKVRHRRSKKEHRRRKTKRKRSTKDRDDDNSISSSNSSASSLSCRRHSKKRHRKSKNHRREKDDKISTNQTSMSHKTNSSHSEADVDILRQKRLEREARESQRQNNILGKHVCAGTLLDNDRGRGYHDQWNPMLSRK